MPVFISQDVDDVVNEPLIGYHNRLLPGVVSDVDTPSDGPRRNALNGLTYNFWRLGTGTQTIEATFPGSRNADYVGIAAHTLGSAGRRVRVQQGTTNVHSEGWFAPSTDAPLMIHFPRTGASSWRVQIEAGPEAYIGVIYLGEVLRMQRRIFRGHTPGPFGRVTDILPQRSVAGQFLGRSVVRRGVATSYSFSNLGNDWYRDNFDPFAQAAQGRAFFIADRPDDYPEDCIFAWTTEDIQPSNTGPRDFMGVSFSVEGIAE